MLALLTIEWCPTLYGASYYRISFKAQHDNLNSPISNETPTMSWDSEHLKRYLNALPQELYDYILDLTITPELSIRYIDRNYRPPAILQIDRTSRFKAAQRYYGDGSKFFCSNYYDCILWLASLSNEHAALLQEVHCESLSFSWMLDLFDYEAKMQRMYILGELKDRGIQLDPDALHIRVRRKHGDPHDQNWSVGF